MSNAQTKMRAMLYMFHQARHTLFSLVELNAPKKVLESATQAYMHHFKQIRENGLSRLYKRLIPEFERMRTQFEEEQDKKFSCVHCQQYLSLNPESQTTICLFGGEFGTSNYCLNCDWYQDK